ncbi:hypothetical protein [Saccharopolyspora griseoalba]|uniref:Uncharacterized protein n=1 Tax=Saccharopolyspora griseoalba TaxID=1431848 RepID=A0ABW2LTF3_9PSEU
MTSTIEEQFAAHKRSIAEAQQIAQNAYEAMSAATGETREKLRDDRDYALRIAEQRIAYLQTLVQMAQFSVLRDQQ